MLTPAQARARVNRIAGAQKASRSRKAMQRARLEREERGEPVPPLEFVIMGPPQPKERARRGKGGHWYTPERTRRYEESVARAAWAALTIARQLETWPLDRKYMVAVTAYFPDARRRDADNVGKAVLDACNTVLWNDDSQAGVTNNPEIDREHPRTVVRVEVVCD